MPESPRRPLRDIRRSYTGEDKIAAKAGLGRRCLGLDRCTPEQRRFRAQLALHVFNGYGTEVVSREAVYRAPDFLSYTMIASPRYDEMAFIFRTAPRNAFGRLIADSSCDFGMPGLRLLASDGFRTFHAVHHPTGARAVFAVRSDFETADLVARSMDTSVEHDLFERFPRAHIPLSAEEDAALNRIPPMTEEIEILLAALIARISAEDPSRTWAVGNWWGDPLRRPKPPGYGLESKLSLWGADHAWTLRWNRYPYPSDLISCLAAPEIGVTGAQAVEDGGGWAIKLGGSSLHLRYGEVK